MEQQYVLKFRKCIYLFLNMSPKTRLDLQKLTTGIASFEIHSHLIHSIIINDS